MSARSLCLLLALGAAQVASAEQLWLLPLEGADIPAWRRAHFRVEAHGDLSIAIGADTAIAPQAVRRVSLPAGRSAFMLGLHDGKLPVPLPEGIEVLAHGNRLALLALDPSRLQEYAGLEHLIPLTLPSVQARIGQELRMPAGKTVDPVLKQALVDAVDGAAILSYLQTLISQTPQGDRYTYRIGDEMAADHLQSVFTSMGYPVQRQTFSGGDPHIVHNIVAVKTGTVFPDEIVVLGAHYDATSQRDNNDGPAQGAEDNGSGTAAVLHLANILKDYSTERTIHFALFGMEEQGLRGSETYVSLALANQDDIVAALTMDMIAAFTTNYRMDIEGWDVTDGDPGSWALLQLVDANVAQYSPGLAREYYSPGFGSDHVPFHVAGIPAMLAIESDYNIYSGYHRTTDTLSNASLHFDTMAQDIARGMMGALADLTTPSSTGSAVALSGLTATLRDDVVQLRWHVAGDGEMIELWRQSESGSQVRVTQAAAQSGWVEAQDRLENVDVGDVLQYRLVSEGGATATASLEYSQRAAGALRLHANQPNPFDLSGGTEIRFALPRSGFVSLTIHDLAGRRVRELFAGEMPAGLRTQHWDGRDGAGAHVAAGVYFVRLWAANRQVARRVTVLP